MKLIDDWSVVFRRAWSVRFALASAVFSAIEIGVQILAAVRPTPWFAFLAATTALLSSLSRIIEQTKTLGYGRQTKRPGK